MSIITKGHSLRGNINNAIDYIINDEKTESWLIGTNDGIIPEHLGMIWKARWKEEEYRGQTVGYHFIQSTDDPNIKPEQLFELATEWVEESTKGEHDYIIAIHKNTNHTHAHIIINPVNRKTKKGWRIFFKKDLPKLRNINDKICKKYGLDTIEKTENNKSLNWWNFQNQIKGDNDLVIIRKAIDYLIPLVKDYEDLKKYLNKIGFSVKDGSEDKMSEDEINEKFKNYNFTVNKKMVNPYLSNESYYFIRIPYTQDWMLIEKENAVWNETGNTLRCKMDFTKSYNIYNSNGDQIIEYDRNGLDIASRWENKNKIPKERTGLRIKPPYRSKYRRCKRIINPEDSSIDYTLEGVIERINNNNRIYTDPKIEEIINMGDLDSKEQNDIRNTFYDNAQIKTKYNQSPLYKMSKKEKYFYFRTKELQDKLDMMAKRQESFENINSLSEMKKLKKEIHKELVKCNSRIREIESSFAEIQIQRMEGILEMSEEELSNLIDKDLVKLRHESFSLKNQYSDITKKIKLAEKEKEKFK